MSLPLYDYQKSPINPVKSSTTPKRDPLATTDARLLTQQSSEVTVSRGGGAEGQRGAGEAADDDQCVADVVSSMSIGHLHRLVSDKTGRSVVQETHEEAVRAALAACEIDVESITATTLC